ncbi:MAG: beta strand repeat-containing protein, partial [Spirochaetota bacterium]
TITSGTLDLNGQNLTVGSGAGTGDIEIQAAGVLDDGGATITLDGSWTNDNGAAGYVDGAGAAGGTVVFANAAVTPVTIEGETTFNNFTSTAPGKTIEFTPGVANRTTINGDLTITGNGGGDNLVSLVSTIPGDTWYIDNVGDAADVDFAFIQDSELESNGIAFPDLADSSNGGGNDPGGAPIWDFGGFFVRFDGDTSDVWSLGDNWSTGTVPTQFDRVRVPNTASNLPARLTGAESVEYLELDGPGDLVDIDGQSLTVLNVASVANPLTSTGTIVRRGGDTLDVDNYTGEIPGTTRYDAGGAIQDYGADDYENLVIDHAATSTMGAALTVSDTLTITDGALSTAGNDLTATTSFAMGAGGDPALILQGSETLSGTVPAGVATAAGLDRGTVEYTTATATGLIAGDTYYDLVVSGADLSLDAPLTVRGDLTLSGGSLDADDGFGPHDITVGGSWNNSGATYTAAGNRVTFTGIGAGPHGITGNGEAFFDLAIAVGVDTINWNDALTVSNSLTLTSGEIDPDPAASDLEHFIAGDWDDTGVTFQPTIGSIRLTSNPADITQGGGNNFFRLRISDGAAVTLQSPIDVNENLRLIDTATFDVGADHQVNLGGSLNVDAAATFIPQNGLVVFDGNGGSLGGDVTLWDATIVAGADLDVNGVAFAVSNAFDIQNGAPPGILYRTGAPGESAPTDFDSGRVHYISAGPATIELYPTDDYYELYLEATLGPPDDTFSVAGDMVVRSLVNMISGTLDLGTNTLSIGGAAPGGIDIQAGTTLRVANGTINVEGSVTGGGTLEFTGPGNLVVEDDFEVANFIPGTSTVEFTNPVNTSYINGSYDWYNLTVTTPNQTISFERGQLQRILTGGQLTVQGSDPGNRVNLLSSETVASPDGYGNPHPGTCPPFFPAAEQWEIEFLGTATALVDYVYVELSYSFDIIIGNDIAVNTPDCTFNWQSALPVDNSGTVDSEPNGRIDRIRVQVVPGVGLNDDFSGFVVRVTGYVVVGFSTGVANDDTFFIDLAEGNDLDTDARPEWEIVSNTSLEALTGVTRFVESGVETPADEAAPILAHTLTYPGSTEIFVAFSEPVYEDQPGDALDAADFSVGGPGAPGITGLTPVTASGSGYEELLLQLDRPVVIGDVVPPRSLTFPATTEDLADLVVPDNTVSISSVAIAPSSSPIVVPVFAQDQTLRDPEAGGLGLIRSFDGSQFLAPEEITIQAFRDVGIPAPPPPSPGLVLAGDSNVSSSIIKNGLWLPFELPGLTLGANPSATVSFAA